MADVPEELGNEEGTFVSMIKISNQVSTQITKKCPNLKYPQLFE